MAKFEVREMHSEFELDLAPLLAVMVKLVPVLITSMVFVQTNVIDTELPQGVEAPPNVEQNKLDQLPLITLNISTKNGYSLEANLNNEIVSQKNVKNISDLHAAFQEMKTRYPDVYQLKIKPDEDISYDEIIKIMDSARKSKDANVKFPVKVNNQTDYTAFMFPDVVFANLLDQ